MNPINPSSSTSSVSPKSSPAAKWLARAVGFSGSGASSLRRSALSKIAMLGLASCGWIPSQAMAQENVVFLKIAGMNGSVTDRYHAGAMDAFGFTRGVEQPGFQNGFVATGSGTGAATTPTAKPNFNLVTVTKPVDSSSPLLFVACVTGQPFANVTLSVAKAGQTQVDCVKFTLTDAKIVKVTSETQAGVPNGVVYETLSLTYSKIQWTIPSTSPTGASSVSNRGYDIAGNRMF